MFNYPQPVETWNGQAKAWIKATDSDLPLSNLLMNERAFLSICGDKVEILSKSTCGMMFCRGFMEFPCDETRHNYLAEFSI